ncbi:hydrolase [Flagellimonas halotolerans]|uniref:Hydrolase n=1 Tax=Flagellimonas halotolerans TaxID=3112164 RepID=A0ABU6INE5_9FLAO|nr:MULTISPECIES: hydrolase [unclassified Allomuricauda]MEC3964687.1 hydrolase [Muricauda sp. SYSU M86414]MEC4264556.1 hydrolase [Muricauda sp. SYSU M84420]
MKSRIFLYLFVFAALLALFQYVTGNNMQKALTSDVEQLQTEVEELKDSLQTMHLKVLDMQYFTLENNDDALAYYDHLDIEDPSRYIQDKLLETNEQKGDNPLIPYEGMESDFKINKIKVLNHKWILADFSDGKYWGDLIIKYELKDDLSVDFTLAEHLLYAPQ